MYSYEQKYDDGRVTYPLCLIYFCPEGCKSEVSMLYAGSKMSVVNISGATKVFEVREKEMLTKDWLQEKVKFFR
ncbi:unnamed protein product [Clavelina lepadiformis]|uniref:ADF-H domain-containing protein n=1 Tax=Clavelina lepadiformis TaxID=159417 RepID=A0ABP0FML9_CLALP